jgi:hypothetical protein
MARLAQKYRSLQRQAVSVERADNGQGVAYPFAAPCSVDVAAVEGIPSNRFARARTA